MSGNGNKELRFDGVSYMLDREYRNTPPYQWGRELTRNGIEADATIIQFGVEWRGVEATSTYRMQYADNGSGMGRDDLREYMGTLGKGSKVVGGPHDNYALGSRMTLLPWNSEGVVVISMQDGVAAMVKMMYDPNAAGGEGAYVLEEVEWDDGETQGLSTVYPPYYDEELKVNWDDAIPELIREAGHGTTFILLGRNLNEDTIDGDGERGESLIYLTRKYFNARFWELPEGVSLRVVEFTKRDRSGWPTSEADRDSYQWRSVQGALANVEYTRRNEESPIQSKGTVELPDGTKAHWWLRDQPTVVTGGVGSSSGFIGLLYRGELYATGYAGIEDSEGKSGAAMYRSFGMLAESVRRRVFVIIEPPEYDQQNSIPGVAPSTGRADLYWIGPSGSESVKPNRWAEAFAENMPEEIQAVINAAYQDKAKLDDSMEDRMRRLADRFKKRWTATRATVKPGGASTTLPTSPGTGSRTPIDAPTPGPRKRTKRRVSVKPREGSGGAAGTGKNTVGQPGTGDTAAKISKVAVGLPMVNWVPASDLEDAPGMMAAWVEPNAVYENGCIMLVEDHPVIQSQIDYWQSQYSKAVGLEVAAIVKSAYAETAVAKVSHVHALTGSVIISEDMRDQMLDNPSLTTSLLGLVSEDAMISPRLGGLGGKRKREDEPSESASDESTGSGATAGETADEPDVA